MTDESEQFSVHILLIRLAYEQASQSDGSWVRPASPQNHVAIYTEATETSLLFSLSRHPHISGYFSVFHSSRLPIRFTRMLAVTTSA